MISLYIHVLSYFFRKKSVLRALGLKRPQIFKNYKTKILIFEYFPKHSSNELQPILIPNNTYYVKNSFFIMHKNLNHFYT